MTETTALGAAFAAGLAVGFWSGERGARRALVGAAALAAGDAGGSRERGYAQWKKAVSRSLDWVD